MDQPAKTRSNVSHLMSTPLTSHNTLQTSTHILTYVSEPLRAVCKPGPKYRPAPLAAAAWLTSSDSDF